MITITAYAFCVFCATPVLVTRQPGAVWTQALMDDTDHPRAACEQATKAKNKKQEPV